MAPNWQSLNLFNEWLRIKTNDTNKMKTQTQNKIITVDAAGQMPGRLASQVAKSLMGKDTPDFKRHLEAGITVKVINAGKLKITDAKAGGKLYVSYSGYPGGQKLATPAEVIAKFGQAEVLKRAVYGMLPGNKLRPRLMKRLSITE